MSAAVHSCSLVLAHAPDLVRHGSKPTREDAAEQIAPRLRTFEEALGYPPHQVFLGNLRPEALWEIERPWWRHSGEAKRKGPFGVFIDEEELYRRLEAADQFQLLRLDGRDPFSMSGRRVPWSSGGSNETFEASGQQSTKARSGP